MNTPPKLAFACTMPWENMRDGDRAKFCASCRRTIPNLSLLSAEERAALAEKARTEKVCASFYLRLSGEMVTPERPLQEKSRVRQFGLAALSASALALATGCISSPADIGRDSAAAAAPVGAPAVEPASAPEDEEEVVLLMGFVVENTSPVEIRGPASKR